MRFRLITPRSRCPDWVEAGFDEYSQRLTKVHPLELVEIKGRRGQITDEDMLKPIRRDDYVVSLDQTGTQLSTPALARMIERWRQSGQNIVFFVGAAEGLSRSLVAKSDLCWSLSDGTFPHQLVRILLAEQLYRAWSYGAGHPYHRK